MAQPQDMGHADELLESLWQMSAADTVGKEHRVEKLASIIRMTPRGGIGSRPRAMNMPP
jgi:hypothetical protein